MRYGSVVTSVAASIACVAVAAPAGAALSVLTTAETLTAGSIEGFVGLPTGERVRTAEMAFESMHLDYDAGDYVVYDVEKRASALADPDLAERIFQSESGQISTVHLLLDRDGSMILFDSKHGTHPEESDTVYVYTSGDTSEVWFTDPVPEPAEWILLVAGVAGTAALARLRGRR